MTEKEFAEQITIAVATLNKLIITARSTGLRVDVSVNRGPGIFGIHEDPDEPKDLVSVRAFRRL